MFRRSASSTRRNLFVQILHQYASRSAQNRKDYFRYEHPDTPILAIFSLKANCYASSNAATDVLAGKLPKNLKALRFHGVGKEWYSLHQYDDFDEPTSETPAQEEAPLSEDEIACLQMYKEASSSRLWTVPANKERPHLNSLSL